MFITSYGNWQSMPLIQVGAHVTSCIKREETGSLLTVIDLNFLSHFADPVLRHNFESSLRLLLCIPKWLNRTWVFKLFWFLLRATCCFKTLHFRQSNKLDLENRTYVFCRICVVVTYPWNSPNDLVLSTKWTWNFWLWSICCNHSITHIYWDWHTATVLWYHTWLGVLASSFLGGYCFFPGTNNPYQVDDVGIWLRNSNALVLWNDLVEGS